MNEIIGEKTIFTWTDGTSSEASLKQITEGFAGKYGKQKADLKEVIVGSSAKSIELNAFRLCKNLEKVLISDKVTDIKEFAFSWCDSLKEVRLPASITRLGISMFQGCPSIESIDIPDSVTIIDEQAFSKCTALRQVRLSENMYWISNESFDGCESLTDIDIPASVEIIDAMAFSNCTSLTQVRFAPGSKIREFGPNAFDGCLEMNLVTPEPLERLERIGGHAFENCRKLEEFVICDKVGLIGESAFNGCISLKSVINIPPALRSFGIRAFSDCKSVEKVHISKNQKNTIPTGTFALCENLKEVEGCQWITEIGAFAFLGCKSLTDITIGLSLAKIGDWAFKGCTELRLSMPSVMLGTDATSYIAGCSLREADLKGRQQFYSSDVIRVSADNALKLAAVDAVSALRRVHADGGVEDGVFTDLEEKLMNFVRGEDERAVTFDMMDEFDVIYGAEEFPLSESVEMFRDRLYFLGQELRLG